MSVDLNNGFVAELHEEVLARAEDTSVVAMEAAFTELLYEDLASFGAVDDATLCRLDEKTTKGRVRCDAYSIERSEGRVDLFVAIYRPDTPGGILNQTDIRHAHECARRIVQLIDEGWDLGDSSKSDQAGMVSALRQAAADVKEIRVFVLTNCVTRDTTEIVEEFGGRQTRCMIWDATRLSRIRASGKDYEAIEIDLEALHGEGIPCLQTADRAWGYRTCLAILPGSLLATLYEEYGSRLLQLNVRSFLQARGKINKGIRNTIINEPSRFLAYNNGLTATAESIKCVEGPNGDCLITHLIGFQVVNGGQTVASIYHAAKKDGAALDDIMVQAKISVVEDDTLAELVPKISRYANTQNRVNEADFSSNDPFHVKIEELSERMWVPGERSRWFYERARGHYQVVKSREATTPARRKKFESEIPTSQKFAKTDLAKYLNSWGMKPDVVSRGAQKNFTAFMSERDSDIEPDDAWYRETIAQAIIFKKAESVARRLKLPSYRPNAVTYTVALVAYRTQQRVDLEKIWRIQAVSQALESTMTEWMPRVHQELTDSAGNRNVGEWCKKPECWHHIQMMDLDLPESLEGELAAGQALPTVGKAAREGKVELTPQDRENIARVMLVPAGVWLEIHGWGIRERSLQSWQSGIAHTLAGYASGKWWKVPSAKQANRAVEIIAIAREHVRSLDEIPGL